MRIPALAVLLIFTACHGPLQVIHRKMREPSSTNYISAVKVPMPKRLIIEEFRVSSDEYAGKPAVRTMDIPENKSVREVLELLERLPEHGPVMMKPGDVPYLKVTLVYERETSYFAFYDGKIKLPDSSFLESNPDQEKELFALVHSLLSR